jgi:ParB family chromosome partitioning protein
VRATNGNVQPIAVRRLKEPVGDVSHEVIFGSRRRAACELAGVEVLAIELDVSDQELVELQEYENRDRVDLSPYEAGAAYKRMLGSNVYRTMAELAKAHNISTAYVSYVVDIASLPQAVLAAFSSPRAISLLWGRTLCAAYRRDPDSLLARAATVPSGASDAAVYKHLLGHEHGRDVAIEKDGKTIAKFSVNDGSVSVRIRRGVLSADLIEQFERLVEDFLKRAGSR